MVDTENPFAGPAFDDEQVAGEFDDASPVAQRRAHIATEANIKSIGWICILFGGLWLLGLLLTPTGLGRTTFTGLLDLARGATTLAAGILLVRLHPLGRLLVLALFLVWLLLHLGGLWNAAWSSGFRPGPILLLFPILVWSLVLAALFLGRARVVFSAEYRRQIIPVTPEVRYRTPTYVWIILGLVLLAVLILVLTQIS